jgi:hypothetical protein
MAISAGIGGKAGFKKISCEKNLKIDCKNRDNI